jgi:hypothetical protein
MSLAPVSETPGGPVSVKHRLRTVFCCAVLEIGALMGVPMRPEQVRDLMQTLNEPKIAQTNPARTADGDKPATRESSAG